jgi:hypothetical protein
MAGQGGAEMKKTLRRGLLAIGIGMGLVLVVLLAFMISLGNFYKKSSSFVYYQCPPRESKGVYVVDLYKVTNRLNFSPPFVIGWVIEPYSFWIPRKPEGLTVFDAREVTLHTTGHLPYDWLTKHGHQLVSGELAVDSTKRMVSVSLTTPDGPFAGNGEYALKE